MNEITAEAELIPAPDSNAASKVPARRKNGNRKRWPPAVVERCKLAFLSGLTLAAISASEAVPLDTLNNWCQGDKWSDQAASVRQQSDQWMTAKMVEWVAQQRELQLTRSIDRCAKWHAVLDMKLAMAKSLDASEIRDCVMSEEKLDLIARRNLGLEDGNGSSGSRRGIGIIANSVSISA